ncbi:BBE domain-containing protein [Actinosynnema sp. NPDC091369]
MARPGRGGGDGARPGQRVAHRRRSGRCGRPARADRHGLSAPGRADVGVGRGTYINYLDPEQDDWAETAYRHNLPRLREVAHRYDPDGVLRFARVVR